MVEYSSKRDHLLGYAQAIYAIDNRFNRMFKLRYSDPSEEQLAVKDLFDEIMDIERIDTIHEIGKTENRSTV